MSGEEKGQKKTERLHMLISPSELKDVDDWRFQNRVGTRAEAVRRLVQIGLHFDNHADGLAETFMRLFEAYTSKITAAAEAIAAEDDASQMFTLAMETYENLLSAMHHLNLVMAPAVAMRDDEAFEAAQHGFQTAKADSMAALFDQKIKMYEFRKKHGILPDKREGNEE